MKVDKAGATYWKDVWTDKTLIHEVDISYYTHTLLHNLYSRFFKVNQNTEIVEIGCALSANLLYFNKYYGYQINGFDYEKSSVLKTADIYDYMGYKANIYHRDFFSIESSEKYDIVSSFGVFEHFKNLETSIEQTKHYLKQDGIILTVIPNMNGVVGFLQKSFNKKVYDVHISYTKEEVLSAHKNSQYETLFCDYYGTYQAGVINLEGIKHENLIKKLLAMPGKPLYYFGELLGLNWNSRFISPYIIYIGKRT